MVPVFLPINPKILYLGENEHGPLGEAVGQVPVQRLHNLDRAVRGDLREGRTAGYLYIQSLCYYWLNSK